MLGDKPHQQKKDADADERGVVWLGQIPLGQEDKYRYPSDFEVEMMLYESETLTEEEFNAMSEEEFTAWKKDSEKIVRKRMEENGDV